MEYPNRDWMYGPRLINGNINIDFYNGLETFIEFATSQRKN